MAGRDLSVCDADCPACAAQRQLDETVNGLILDMWVQAVHDGECSVENALRKVEPAISMMNPLERNRTGWRVTRQMLAIKPKSRRKLRGYPTSWVKFNRELVDALARAGFPKTSPYAERGTTAPKLAFDEAAALWKKHGIDRTAYDVKTAYYAPASHNKNSS